MGRGLTKVHLEKFDEFAFHNAGDFAPLAVLLDDKEATVAEHMEFLSSKNFSFYLTDDVEVARKLHRELKNDAVYFFDMHMNAVKEINGRSTNEGVTVGFTLICDITNDGQKNRLKHCATLTEYTMPPETEQYFNAVENNGQLIENVRKDTGFELFESCIRRYEDEYLKTIKGRMVKRNVRALEKAYAEIAPRWFNVRELSGLFGFVAADRTIWEQNQTEIFKCFSLPEQERLEALAYIREGLILFFGPSDIESQRNWMSTARNELDGKRVWDLLISGSMADLYAAANFVNRVIG